MVPCALMPRVQYKCYWAVVLQHNIHHRAKHAVMHTLCSSRPAGTGQSLVCSLSWRSKQWAQQPVA